jgi:23S rRNA pseudouridine2605 synthase
VAPAKKPAAKIVKTPRFGVARVISKLGVGSRTQAASWVREGRVRVNGVLIRDAEFPVRQGSDRISVEGLDSAPAGRLVVAAARLVVMLNKPRGLVTSAADERGRDTVYRCFAGSKLPWLGPVGRLDKASEGLLLFSNDPKWSAGITDPATGPPKKYHVQIDRLADAQLLANLERGVQQDGEHLSAMAARALRAGTKHAWLEIELQEGRNRQIRRLLAAFDVAVLRLVRTAIGTLSLGDLPKGGWRVLSAAEIGALTVLK